MSVTLTDEKLVFFAQNVNCVINLYTIAKSLTGKELHTLQECVRNKNVSGADSKGRQVDQIVIMANGITLTVVADAVFIGHESWSHNTITTTFQLTNARVLELLAHITEYCVNQFGEYPWDREPVCEHLQLRQLCDTCVHDE